MSVTFLTNEDKTELQNNIQGNVNAINQLSKEITNMTLGVHTDGLIYIFQNGIPVGNGVATGTTDADIIGNIDSANNIVLYANLPVGEYNVKYEMENGDLVDIGTLAVAEDAPVMINQIPISTDENDNLFVGTNGEKGYKAGYRLSASSGTEKSVSGYFVTGFIPVNAGEGDVIRIKNLAIANDSNALMCFYDGSKQPLNGGTSTYGTTLYNIFVTHGKEENGVYTATLDDAMHMAIGNNLAYIRIASTAITEETILTVNQEIV